MIVCDVCGENKECFERHIEGKEYDVCINCWTPIAAKLKGKGRVTKEREIVLLPSSSPQPEPTEPKPSPEHPPKIWGSVRNELQQDAPFDRRTGWTAFGAT